MKIYVVLDITPKLTYINLTIPSRRTDGKNTPTSLASMNKHTKETISKPF
jgi:hypothetical protein